MMQQKKSVPKKYISYNFPLNLDDIKQFCTEKQLKRKFKLLFKANNFYDQFPYHICYKQQNLIIKCRKCRHESTLSYINYQEKWVLEKFYNYHKHLVKEKKSFNSQKVQRFLQYLPITMKKQQQMKLIMTELKINAQKYKYHKKNMQDNHFTIQQLLRGSQNMIFSYKLSLKDPIPQFLIVIHNDTAKWISKCGNRIALQFLNIKNRKIGLFIVLTPYIYLMLLGFVILHPDKPPNYSKILKKFLSLICFSSLRLLTKPNLLLKKHIQNLQQLGQYHIEHKQLIQDSSNKIEFNKLKMCTSVKQYKMYLQQLMKQSVQIDQLLKIDRNKDLQVLAYGEPSSILYNNFRSKYLHRLEYALPHKDTNYTTLYQCLLKKIDCKFVAYPPTKNIKVEDIMGCNILKVFKDYLCTPIFQLILSQFVSGSTFTIFSKTDNQLQFSDGNCVREVKQAWICNCLWTERTGLCCRHIIKTVLTTQTNKSEEAQGKILMSYVQSQWHTIPLTLNKCTGRPKLTRRNNMK